MNKLFLICLLVSLTISAAQAESVLKPYAAVQTYVARPIAVQKTIADDIDLGPYIRNLQRTIKLNWNPPKNSVQKRVVTSFVIEKNGNLLNYVIKESSGDRLIDEAAIMAIRKTAPFNPLPSNLKKNNIEILFTFEQNVLSASRIK